MNAPQQVVDAPIASDLLLRNLITGSNATVT